MTGLKQVKKSDKPVFFENCPYLLLAGGGAHRQAELVTAVAHFRKGGFYGDGIYLCEHFLNEAVKPKLDFPAFFRIFIKEFPTECG